MEPGESIGLVLIQPGHGGTEVSYQFLPALWGNGFAGEAVASVMRHAFDSGTLELLAVTQTANQRSRRLLERLGLTVDQEFEEHGAEQILYKATPDLLLAQ